MKFQSKYNHIHSRKCIWECNLQNVSHFVYAWKYLTHLPLVLHIYASVNWAIIGSGNGLSPIWCQAITWTNAGLLSIGLLGTNFSEFWIRILSLSCKKMNLKMLSAKCQPFCLCQEVFNPSILPSVIYYPSSMESTTSGWGHSLT